MIKVVVLLVLMLVQLGVSLEAAEPIIGKKAGERRMFTLLGGVEVPFRWCPPTGPDGFTVGSPASEKGRKADEKERKVHFKEGFWIAELEFSIGSRYHASKGYHEIYRYVFEDKLPEKHGELPVVYVNSRTACHYINAINYLGKLEGGTVSMPTEAQWEYACRAGTNTAFAFGEKLTQKTAIFGTGEFKVYGANRKVANNWGIQHMHGNVFEWCRVHEKSEDLAGLTEEEKVKAKEERYFTDRVFGSNYLNLSLRTNFVRKGGSSNSNAVDCRVAARCTKYITSKRGADSGMRLVIYPSKSVTAEELMERTLYLIADGREYTQFLYKIRGNLEKAEKLGDVRAEMWRAIGLHSGIFGYDKDEAKAQELAKGILPKLGALSKTDVQAKFLVYKAFDLGLGVKQNTKKANSWLKKAAKDKHLIALQVFGEKLKSGAPGIKSNPAFGEKLIKEAKSLSAAPNINITRVNSTKVRECPLARIVGMKRQDALKYLVSKQVLVRADQAVLTGPKFYEAKPMGFSFKVNKDDVVIVVDYLSEVFGYKPYNRELPYGMKWGMTHKDLKALLGEPDTMRRVGADQISCSYNLGRFILVTYLDPVGSKDLRGLRFVASQK